VRRVECLFIAPSFRRYTNLYRLVNRGTLCVNNFPRVVREAERPGLEPATYWMQVQSPITTTITIAATRILYFDAQLHENNSVQPSFENLYSPETGSEKNLTILTKKRSCPHIHHNHIPHSPQIPKCYTILSQCLNLHKNFSLLFSIISLGTGKLKYNLQLRVCTVVHYAVLEAIS